MPSIPLKRIIAFSSEDDVHKASNLLCPSAGGLHWSSAPEYRSKCLTVEIELAKLTKIAQIEVGNLRSAFVEVLVGITDSTPTNTSNSTNTSISTSNSSGGSGVSSGVTEYVSLLPQSMLMTAEESKNGRNTTRTKVFNQDRLSRTALDKKWKYIKIQCLQPYLTDIPYGLRYIKLYQTSGDHSQLPNESEPPSPSLKLSPRLFNTPQHTRSLQSPVSTNKRGPLSAPAGLPRTPKLPSLSSFRGDILSDTPKRPKREQDSDVNDSQEFEFAGLEKQSRLLKNTLRGDNEKLLNSNPILNRIAQEKKEKEKQQEENFGAGGGYVRRKLLHRDLEKVSNKGIDFMSSYDDEKSASWERSKTARIFSSMNQLDDSCEMGEEDTSKSWFGKRSRRRDKSSPAAVSGKWIKRGGGGKGKRKRENSPPPNLFDVPLLMESKQTKLFDYYMNCSSGEDKTNEDTGDVICTGVNETNSKSSDDPPQYHECPICNELLPSYALELHATECAERTFDSSTTSSNTHVTSASSIVSQRSLGVVYLD